MKNLKEIFIFLICFVFTSIPVFAGEEINLIFDENYQAHSINITNPEDLAKGEDENNQTEIESPIDVSGIESIQTPLPEIVVSEQIQPMTLFMSIHKSIAQTIKNLKECEIDMAILPMLQKLRMRLEREILRMFQDEQSTRVQQFILEDQIRHIL